MGRASGEMWLRSPGAAKENAEGVSHGFDEQKEVNARYFIFGGSERGGGGAGDEFGADGGVAWPAIGGGGAICCG